MASNLQQMLLAGGAVIQPALALTLQSHNGSTSSLADQTFTGMALSGTPTPDRWLIACAHGFGTNRILNTVNANGVGMTQLVAVGSGTVQPSGIFAQAFPTGTTVDIELIFSGTEGSGCAVELFTITGNATISLQDAQSSVSVNPGNITMTTINGGVAIALASRNAAITGSWNADLAQAYQLTTTPSQLRSAATGLTTGASVNPQYTFSSASTAAVVGVSIRSGP